MSRAGPQDRVPAGRTDARVADFVFADPDGRRWRMTRVILFLLAAALLVLVATAACAGTVGPRPPEHFDVNAVSPRGAQDSAPAVGDGPVETVVAVHRDTDGQVWGTDLVTGERVAPFGPADVDRIGDATFALYRSGYERPAKTLTLTFDDGPDPATTRQLLDVLGTQHVPAAFFMQGKSVAENPDLVRRMVAEGHVVGGHTVNHPVLGELPRWRQQFEIAATERAIRAVAGTTTEVWRMPYDDGEDAEGYQAISPLVLGQHMGYRHIGYDFDTTDWKIVTRPGAGPADIPLPDFDSGRPMTVLLHDAGGPHREVTVAYVRDYLIPAARAHGYTFASLPQANAELAGANTPVVPTLADRAALVALRALFVWPSTLMRGLFYATVLLAFTLAVLNALLAVARHHRLRRRTWPDLSGRDAPTVTVLLAAFNEERVIERTVRSVLRSDYPIHEVVVVDDGSRDATAAIVRRLAEEDPRVHLLQQANTGKSAALNNGIERLSGELVVTIDADTVVVPQTVTNLVRRFADDPEARIGVVAGVVRVGNRGANILTRWQALEYVAQIGVDRAAQSMLDAIAIVPGACAAWRRSVLQAAGGFKTDNLAEDADLAMTMHELGFRVEQDDEAYAFTEAPETLDDLLKQRIRWTYGILQTMWKHRRLMFDRRSPGIGFYVLPNYVLSLLVPLVLFPLTVVMALVAVQNEGAGLLAVSFAVFLFYQLVLSAVAVKLMGESWSHLVVVPLYRLIFEPLRAYLLYSTALAALKGTKVSWNRVTRTGSVDDRLDSAPTAGALLARRTSAVIGGPR